MFIDFGAGFYVEKHLRRYKSLSPSEYILGIDAISNIPEKFTEFNDIMKQYYIKDDTGYIKVKEPPFKYFDHYMTGFRMQDDIQLEKKADKWICISTLEHVLEGDVFSVLEGIIQKVEKNSVGQILIDLTDHRQYPANESNCFYHYQDPLYRSHWNPSYVRMFEQGNAGIFLNRIRKNQWFTILDTFFTYKIAPDDDNTRVSIFDVRVKNS